jgi:MoaA/NifB/PqqE/SkfB family radical SAM enzyme
MESNPVSWFDLSEAEKDRIYPLAVRSAFGEGTIPNDVAAQVFIPPMRSLESVQIEITTWCNLACRQCSRTKGIAAGTWTNGHIALDDYATIVAKLPSAWRLILQGVGEPSLHPHFADLVRLASETGKYGYVAFNTNGHSHNEPYWRELAAKYRCSVSLSIDSLDPEIAELCRSGTDVAVLASQLLLFKEIFPGFSVTLVASRMNLRDIPRTLRKIAEIGGIPVGIQGVITADEGVALDAGDNLWLSGEALSIMGEFPGFNVTGADGNAGISGDLKRCVAPFVAPFITIGGELTPCCAGIDPAAYQRTSLLDERTWDAVRASAPVTDWFRSYVAEDPPMCRACSFNPRRSETVRSSKPAARFDTGAG